MSLWDFDRDPHQITDPIKSLKKFKTTSQGKESNIQGKACEDMIEASFKSRGVHVLRHVVFRKGGGDLFEERLLIKNFPFKNMYGHTSRTEFVYQHACGMRVRIECKTQETEGSVDEKFPYMLENAKNHMPEKFIWFVMDGLGARPKAIQWLKNESVSYKRKKIRVLSLAEARMAIKALAEEGVA